jgi:site-specific DNA-methyltransferase (adenine-specific)
VTQGFTSGMRTSLDDTWTTPREFFDELNKEFNFGLDAAALQNSTLVPDNWYGPDHPDPAARDALRIDWNHNSRGRPIWLNPPYGRVIKEWVRKASEVASGGGTVVCLVPARTDTHWWHDYCINAYEIRYIRGRLKFGGQKNSAPFPSALVIMK